MAKIELTMPTIDEGRLIDPVYSDHVLSWLGDGMKKMIFLRDQSTAHGPLSSQAIEAMPPVFALFMHGDIDKANAALAQASFSELQTASVELGQLMNAIADKIEAIVRRSSNRGNN